MVLHSIGKIITPYEEKAPYQPVADKGFPFCIEIQKEYAQGLKLLDKFRYIYVLYYAHKAKPPRMLIKPSWAGGIETGLFASRSPNRPNPLILSVVEILRIENNKIFIPGIDAFNHTPVLDIKPYIQELDSKADAGYGWVDDLEDREHLKLHIKGIPHQY